MGIERKIKPVKKRDPGPELVASLGDLLSTMQKGESLKQRYTMRTVELVLEPREFSPDAVRRLREKLRTSQGVFAKLLGVSIQTVQAWEQGNNPPSPMARRLLEAINRDTKPWSEMLKTAAEYATDSQ